MRTQRLIAVALVILTPLPVALAQDRARVPQGPQGTVTLPVTEYNRLVDRAAQPDTTPEPPPVAAVVGRADVRARVTGETVRGTLRLDGEVFQRGQVKVTLVSGATLVDARTDGRSLPLLHDGDSHVAVLPGPAPFTVALEWVAPVTAAPGRASFALPVPAAGSVSATLDLPGDPAEVKVDGGLVTRRQTSGGRTTVDVTLEPGRRAQASWSVRETAAPVVAVAARTLADVKSLVTIGEADLRMVSLVDVTVVQGEPQTFEVRLPAGFEVSSISGSSLDTSDVRADAIALTVRDPSARRHQFLISLEQAHAPGSFKVDTSFPTVTGVQREVGETAIEGIGTIDVTATGDEGLRRMDVRETHPALRSLARQPLLAAFRYQRRPEEKHVLSLEVKRFADAPVIAAVAERVVATTLVTTEGRTLTEVALSVRNRAQPFMKVTLPSGATMLSVEVAGEAAKPVTGPDGTRVPLLRTGFRPDGVYSVSFVYLNAGEAFGKRGDTQLALPRFDVPVSILEWELFLPDRYSAKPNGGNVIPSQFLPLEVTVAGVAETVEVRTGAKAAPEPKEQQQAPSQNVLNLQRRVAGVLPVRIDVPRTGTSFRFVRPLVLDEETVVSFRYKKR